MDGNGIYWLSIGWSMLVVDDEAVFSSRSIQPGEDCQIYPFASDQHEEYVDDVNIHNMPSKDLAERLIEWPDSPEQQWSLGH